MKEKPKRKIEDIQIDEVSVVNAPANKQSFLFYKGAVAPEEPKLGKLEEPVEVAISSDGTEEGTKIIVNGTEIENINDFSFYYCKRNEMGENPIINCSYGKIVESTDGFQRSETYWLTKNAKVESRKGDKPMLKTEILNVLKKLAGVENYEFVCKKESKEDMQKNIKAALEVVDTYIDDMPDYLKTAVKALAEYAAMGMEAEEEMMEEEKKDEKVTSASQDQSDPLNKEVVENKDVKVSEPEDKLAKALEALYQDWTIGGDISREMGINGRRSAIEVYDWETIVYPQWKQLLEGLNK